MVGLVIKRAAPKNIWTLVGMSAMLLATLCVMAWYGYFAYTDHLRQLKAEAQRFSQALRVQADDVVLHLKDIAVLAASDSGHQHLQSVLQSGHKSPYVRELGYFSSGDVHSVEVLHGAGLFMPDNDPALQALGQKLLTYEGQVVATSPVSFPVLFWRLKPTDLVMMQKNPDSGDGKAFKIVYAVVDLEALLRDTASQLSFSTLRSAKLWFDNREVTLTLDDQGSWLEQSIDPKLSSQPVALTANLKVTGDLQDRFENFRTLMLVIGGLFLIALFGTGLFVIFVRTQSKYERELTSALDEARQASEAKSSFLANMSHEIRTPLNGVLGMAELAMRTQLDKEQKRYVSQIKSSGQTLLAILNDVLDLSKLESGQLAIDPLPTELPELLREIVSFHVPAAQSKGISLELEVDPYLPRQVEIDPTRLRQILSNLLNNALKFTENGFVRVSVRCNSAGCEEAQTFLEVSVKDSGIGIADGNIRKLFSRFAQAEQNTARLYGGTGLGLSICKQLCENMGGMIGVVSELGSGSEFSFSLPVKVLEKARLRKLSGQNIALVRGAGSVAFNLERIFAANGIGHLGVASGQGALEALLDAQLGEQPLTGVMIDEGNNLAGAVALRRLLRENPTTKNLWCGLLADMQSATSFKEFDCVVVKPLTPDVVIHAIAGVAGEGPLEPRGTARGKPALKSAPNFTGKHVLLVDDNNVNLMFGEEILKDFGCEVTIAMNGHTAIERCQEGRFDAILLDCQMPVMDGYEAAGILRARIQNGQMDPTPIIALTANALKGDREKCLAAGMDEFLSKPIKVEELQKMLQRMLSQKDTRSGQARTTGQELPSDPDEAKGKIPLIDVALYTQSRDSVKQFPKLLEFYRADTENYLKDIKRALQERQIDNAVLPAHTIKSSSRIVGALGMAALAENFELRAKRDAASELAALDQLRIHMERIFALTLEKIDQLQMEQNPAA